MGSGLTIIQERDISDIIASHIKTSAQYSAEGKKAKKQKKQSKC